MQTLEQRLDLQDREIVKLAARVTALAKALRDESLRNIADNRVLLAIGVEVAAESADPLLWLDGVRKSALDPIDSDPQREEVKSHIERTLAKIEGAFTKS